MSTGFSPARSPTDHTDATEPRFDLNALAEKAEKRLTEHLEAEYDREPTEEEVEWVRGFPRRMAEERHPEEPRLPTLTEMREEFGWGPSKSEKDRWGEGFAEQQASGPDLSYR